jgi:peptidoglycan hydrolase-like protein with peptidoglycan-binding domain
MVILSRRRQEASNMSTSNAVRARIASIWIAAVATLLLPGAVFGGMICASYVYHPNLVRAVQKALLSDGATGIATDGKWGPKSREALRAFQARKGLPVSGEVDEPTFRALLGTDVPYEGVTVRRNPTNAPEDVYRSMCPETGP